MNMNSINDNSKMPKYVDNGECSRVISFERNQKGQEEIVIWNSESKQTRIPNDNSINKFQQLFDAVPSCPDVEFVPMEKQDEAPLADLLDDYYRNN